MDPITFALISGGAGFLGSKLAGMDTKDAFRQGLLSGGLSFLTPAAAIESMGTKQGLQQLLTQSVKQGVAGRIGKKLGVPPALAMSLASQYKIPGVDEPLIPIPRATNTGIKTVPSDAESIDDLYTTGKEFNVAKQINNANKDAGVMDKITGLFKTGNEYDINKIAKGATLFGVPALLYATGAFKAQPTTMYAPSYNINYPELREARGGMQRIDPVTGQVVEVAMQETPETLYPTRQPYAFTEQTFYPKKYAEGGLASFATGGINYLPSKLTHDENDSNNYKRASGYIEDGTGNGSKDEDTMLAQLADGEFVTRTDGVLGAGILAGANPKNEKEMREKGAKYFYEQQARFKRIFDLLNANRTNKLH